ncbi:MAG: hypothetical protein J6P42_00005, partial [Oscillospiraceae bacterium]|nr:hypothetical protein [Oscillospiraceae bacterium]MBO7373323.1 hypothetical protein [Oscillospiraceae bacterium]
MPSVAQKADNVDLYRQLLDLSAQALDLQEENARLKAENTELRKGREIASKICRHHSPWYTFARLLTEDPSFEFLGSDDRCRNGILICCHHCGRFFVRNSKHQQ